MLVEAAPAETHGHIGRDARNARKPVLLRLAAALAADCLVALVVGLRTALVASGNRNLKWVGYGA